MIQRGDFQRGHELRRQLRRIAAHVPVQSPGVIFHVINLVGPVGFALLALLLHNQLIGAEFTQPLLAAITLSMLISPFLIRHNKRIARFLLRETGPLQTGLERLEAANQALARREHVILCGYGRVGQNVGRVLEGEGFEFLAMDLDPVRVRTARAAGDAVIYGDAADEGLLKSAGLDRASAVVVTFSDPSRSIPIVQAVRRLREDLPILVRAIDDTHLEALLEAGATEVVPETLEAALTLVSNTLHRLNVPASRVIARGSAAGVDEALLAVDGHAELPLGLGNRLDGDRARLAVDFDFERHDRRASMRAARLQALVAPVGPPPPIGVRWPCM